jgi:hypothetical protein
LQGGPDDLGRIDDALGNQIAVLSLLYIVTEGVVVIVDEEAKISCGF